MLKRTFYFFSTCKRKASSARPMAMLCSVFRQFLFIVLVLQVSSGVAASHSPVKFLPGFEGPLPFELETGYVGVGESEDVQLFYYFVKSANNPTEDPLLLWLTGGPGCSAFSALFYEIGPLYFQSVPYHGSLPTLELNPHSWTQVSNIIFLDSPVGTGFSYATTSRASHSGDFQATQQTHEFLRKWLIDHPEFLSNPVYVGGDSYSGITLPLVVQRISNGNEDGTEPFINLKGYLLGNPVTDTAIETTAQFRFAHGMALISDELYESLKTSCGDEYPFKYPINIQCIKDVQAYYKCISGIQIGQILEPLCAFASPKPEDIDIFLRGRRYLIGDLRERLPEPSLSAFECRTDGYILAPLWANNDTVQEALHIRKNTIREWQRCAMGLSYTPEIRSSLEYHVNLSKKGYRSLIYSGDHDLIVPFFSTQAWIRSLNYSIVDDWRSWMVEGEVGGYTRTYSNQMTFATIKGGGHTAPEYRPKECFSMFKRWVSSQPL